MCYDTKQHFNHALQKYLTETHKDFWQARIFPNKHYNTIFVELCPYLEKLEQKTNGFRHRLQRY